MSGKRVAFALACVSAAACANILGIDDGIPRVDASLDVGVPDGPDDAVSDAGADVEAEAPFSPLSCGTLTCNFAAGETCCRRDAASYACVDDAAACKGDLNIPCDRPEQCGGSEAGPKECCTTDTLSDSGVYVATSVACMTAAQCEPIPTHYILCGDDSGKDCADATTCSMSVTTLPGFLICK
jgi:hypothetical protein